MASSRSLGRERDAHEGGARRERASSASRSSGDEQHRRQLQRRRHRAAAAQALDDGRPSAFTDARGDDGGLGRLGAAGREEADRWRRRPRADGRRRRAGGARTRAARARRQHEERSLARRCDAKWRSTARSSSPPSSGLVRYSSTPASKPRTRSSGSCLDVTMIIGTSLMARRRAAARASARSRQARHHDVGRHQVEAALIARGQVERLSRRRRAVTTS